MKKFQCEGWQASKLCKKQLDSVWDDSSHDWDYATDAGHSLNHVCITWSYNSGAQWSWSNSLDRDFSSHLVLVLLRDLTQFPLIREDIILSRWKNPGLCTYLEVHINLNVQVTDIAVIWLESEYAIHLFPLNKRQNSKDILWYAGIIRTLTQVRYSSR